MIVEAWVPITIAAAFFQNLRSALQKHLGSSLSTTGAAYARFVYALPPALVYLVAVRYTTGEPWPAPGTKFFVYCLLGGVAQILFTVFLLWLFSFRSFAVGTTFSKLEVVMVAVLGALILGDGVGPYAIAAIALSAIGVLALTMSQSGLEPRALLRGLGDRPTLIGIACAAWLGASVVFFRGASLSLEGTGFLLAAATTLAFSLVIQTLLMGAWLVVREPGQLGSVLRNWKWAGAVGLAGALASIGWFTAFTMQNASYVRALGQIELLFTWFATTRVFRERVGALDVAGIVLVAAGIVLIVLAG